MAPAPGQQLVRKKDRNAEGSEDVKPIQMGWEEYRRVFIPEGQTAEQVRALEQAYYAGAVILHMTVMKALDPEPGATASDVALMTGLHAEIAEWENRVIAPAAGRKREH